MAMTIAGRQFWLWRAVDDKGEVLDLLAQRRADKTAAVKLMRKLLKKQGFTLDVRKSHRAENSNQPTDKVAAVGVVPTPAR
jgi:transposase-like protein